MLRLRLLLLLVALVLFVSAAWADDIGYIDCASHPDASQVYTKPRQSQDVVGSVACGERFIILVNGFIFSRIQTSDGKIGFVLSSLISVDRSATAIPQSAARTAAPATKAPAAPAPQTAAAVAQVQPQPAAAQTQPAPAQPSIQSQVTPAASSAAPTPSVNAQPSASTASQPAQAAAQQPEPVAAQSASAPASSAAPASATSDQPAAPASALPTPPPPPDAQPASAQPSSTPSMLTPPPPASAAPQPAPAAATQPEPAPAQPEATPVRSASVRSTWEKPVPAGRQASLMEFFGGFSFARFDGGGGTFNNMMGGLGSFGINLTSWLQVTGDSSYNFVTISGTKNVLYGNHFGPRVYYRKRNRWHITPFGEALVGGSRLDTTVSGSSGYNTSTNCISYKFGGGIDMRAGHHWEIRVFDFDYYRTAFGTNLHQNNYSASVGVVLRLFGGSAE